MQYVVDTIFTGTGLEDFSPTALRRSLSGVPAPVESIGVTGVEFIGVTGVESIGVTGAFNPHTRNTLLADPTCAASTSIMPPRRRSIRRFSTPCFLT